MRGRGLIWVLKGLYYSHQDKLLSSCGVDLKNLKNLENKLQGMGVSKTYSEAVELLYEGIFSKFGQTYPFVFRGDNLDLGQGD
jgi:hypothetical protein